MEILGEVKEGQCSCTCLPHTAKKGENCIKQTVIGETRKDRLWFYKSSVTKSKDLSWNFHMCV